MDSLMSWQPPQPPQRIGPRFTVHERQGAWFVRVLLPDGGGTWEAGPYESKARADVVAMVQGARVAPDAVAGRRIVLLGEHWRRA